MTSSLVARSDEPDGIRMYCMYILDVTIQSGTWQSILCNEGRKEAEKKSQSVLLLLASGVKQFPTQIR